MTEKFCDISGKPQSQGDVRRSHKIKTKQAIARKAEDHEQNLGSSGTKETDGFSDVGNLVKTMSDNRNYL